VALLMPDQKYYVEQGEDMEKHRRIMETAAADLLLAAGAPDRTEANRQARVLLVLLY
jgi:hypothetical protein